MPASDVPLSVDGSLTGGPAAPRLRFDPAQLPTAIELFTVAADRLTDLLGQARVGLTAEPPGLDAASEFIAVTLTARSSEDTDSAAAAMKGALIEIQRIKDALADSARQYGYVEDANTGKFQAP